MSRLRLPSGPSAASSFPRTAFDALETARMLDQYGVFWMEDFLNPEDYTGYARVAEGVEKAGLGVRIAAGEQEATAPGFRRLISEGRIHVAQPDLSRCGGLTVARKIGWIAREASIDVCPHAWLTDLLGLPAGLHGHLEDTASSGLVTALAAARAAAPGRRVVVCSEHTHSSTAKAARLLELELRTVPGDETFAMRPELVDLTDACALVATIGTTSSTAIDPVPELAERCAEAGAWLHVDAAYAGSAAVCPELRHLFAGWELADSIGVNPHKWLFTPMDCSVFWSRRPDALRAAFSLVPEYLRVSEDVVSLSEYGVPLGRRFRALKLWAVLRCFGREGLQAVIREHVRLAALFEQWVRDEPGWEVCAPRPFSLVCFRRDGSDEENEALLERVNATGEAFLSHTRLDDRLVLRLAIGNARTTEDDVRHTWELLRGEAAR